MMKLYSMKIIQGVFVAIVLYSCNQTVSNPTKLDSADYTQVSDRVEAFKKEIKSPTDFSDAEFLLFNVNGFHAQRGTFPGASSWDYKFAIKVNPNDITKWTNDMQENKIQNCDDSWTKTIIKNRPENWKVSSVPKCFSRDGNSVTVIVYPKEGIIFKRVENL